MMLSRRDMSPCVRKISVPPYWNHYQAKAYSLCTHRRRIHFLNFLHSFGGSGPLRAGPLESFSLLPSHYRDFISFYRKNKHSVTVTVTVTVSLLLGPRTQRHSMFSIKTLEQIVLLFHWLSFHVSLSSLPHRKD